MSAIFKLTLFVVIETVLTIDVANSTIVPFPFNQFWNLSRADADAFSPYGSCRQDYRIRCCECQDACFHYGTCCIDKLWIELKNPIKLDDYVTQFLQKSTSVRTNSFTCEDVYPLAKDMGHISRSYLMVTSCKNGAKPDDVTACQSRNAANSLENMIPVIGSDNYIYKNRFCALCSFVATFELVNIGVLCPSDDEENDNVPPEDLPDQTFTWNTLKEKQDCTFSLNNTGIHVSKCKSIWNKRCPRVDNGKRDKNLIQKPYTDNELCAAYTGGYQLFPNYHCWRCRDESISDENVRSCPIILGDINRLITLHMLLQFTPSPTVPGDEDPLVLSCQGNTIPDIYQGKCVQQTCPRGYQIVQSKCINVLSDFNKLKESRLFKCLTGKPIPSSSLVDVAMTTASPATQSFLNFKITQNNNTDVIFNQSKFFNKMSSILNVPSSAFTTNSKIGHSLLVQVKYNYVNEVLSKIIGGEVFSNLTNQILDIVDTVLLTSRYQLLLTPTKTVDRFPGKQICIQYEPLDMTSFLFTDSCDVINNNSRVLQPSDVISIAIQITENKTTQHIVRCKKFMQHNLCTSFNYSISDVTFASDDSLVHIDKDGRKNLYPVGHYVPFDNNHYGVCVDAMQTEHDVLSWISGIRSVLGYVSFSGHALSCFCHVLVLATFCLFEPPRHGLLCLCVSLFLSDLIFLVIATLDAASVHVSRAMCRLIAASIHFVLLSVQACSVASAIDLFVTLGNRLTLRPQSMSFRKTSLCVLLFPLTILLLSLVLGNYNVTDIRYGDGDVCWFTGFNGRLFFYIIPGVLTFSLSVGLITYTICSLSNVYNTNKKVLKGSGAKNVSISLVALKLVVTYGVSEGIGFIQIPITGQHNMLTENERLFNFVFEFLYTIVRSYRGVLLFVIYVCKRSMIQKYKRLLRSKRCRNTSSVKRHSQKPSCEEDEEEDEDEISEADKTNTNDFKDIMNSIETSLSVAVGKELFDNQRGEDYFDSVSTKTQLKHMNSEGGDSSVEDDSFMWNMYETGSSSSLPKDRQVSFYQPESYITKSFNLNKNSSSSKFDVLTIEDSTPPAPTCSGASQVYRVRSKTISTGLSVDKQTACHVIFKE